MPADPFFVCGRPCRDCCAGGCFAGAGIRGSGRLRGAVSCGSAVCGVWRGRRGGLPTGRPPVLGRGLSGRLGGGCAERTSPLWGQGFRRWGEREVNAALAAVFIPDGRKVRLRVRAGRSFAPCVPQLSGRMSAARSCVPQLRPETQRPGDPYVRSPGRRSGSAVRYFSAGFR